MRASFEPTTSEWIVLDAIVEKKKHLYQQFPSLI